MSSDSIFKPYKFKHLKTYASAEWMFNKTKKYRTVFDQQELSYLRVELTFYNKWFDEKDWKAKVTLKLISVDKNELELCVLDQQIDVKADQNEISVHDGWGTNTTIQYFKKGTYRWEAFLENELVGSINLFVNDIGLVSETENPYFDFQSMAFFEEGGQFSALSPKKYLTTFKRETARFIYTEFYLKIKTSLDFQYEFIINYFDNANQLKGQTLNTGMIEANNEGKIYKFEVGWGSETSIAWNDTEYRVDVVFNDVCIGSGIFYVGNENIEGKPLMENSSSRIQPTTSEEITQLEPTKSLEELLAELDELIGLKNIKNDVREILNLAEFNKIRKEKGFSDNQTMSLHSLFLGNPGTGKTTIARHLGKIYASIGMLSKGHVVEVDRSDLIGEFIGQTAPKVKTAIENARGGVLFIDEAYALTPPDNERDFGREAIEILLKEMSDGKGDIAIFCAGYTAEMNHFIQSNPGLKSRFNQTFKFEDYLPEELVAISKFACESMEVELSPEAEIILNKNLMRLYRDRSSNFGNARLVNSIIAEAKINLADRIMKLPNLKEIDKAFFSLITDVDIQSIFKNEDLQTVKLDIDEVLLQNSLQELNNLTGLADVKNHIKNMVKLTRFYQETGKNVLHKISLHTIFTGNPGTGKTTVARILAKIYNALGLLESGHCVETDKSGLVAEYTGQTAQKTLQIIEKAMGGVLFIDEAYALNDGSSQFGQEAIELLLKQMEDKRGKFAVFAAGYTDNMNQFLHMNPGLQSRFNEFLHFADYDVMSLMQIAKNMLEREDLNFESDAEKSFEQWITLFYQNRNSNFGNARFVREITEDLIRIQHLRLADIASHERKMEDLTTIKLIDIDNLNLKITNANSRSRIGF